VRCLCTRFLFAISSDAIGVCVQQAARNLYSAKRTKKWLDMKSPAWLRIKPLLRAAEADAFAIQPILG
jgi:hypothetical protein